MSTADKPPLDWKPQERFERDGVVAELNYAVGKSGRKMHSFSLSCVVRDGKLGRHFRPENVQALLSVLEEVDVAIKADTSFDNRPFRGLKAATR